MLSLRRGPFFFDPSNRPDPVLKAVNSAAFLIHRKDDDTIRIVNSNHGRILLPALTQVAQ